MTIATVTLNPAFAMKVRGDAFQANTVNRGQRMQFDAGGKGVNVASFLADYGHAGGGTGFVGQENADIVEQLFARKGIDDRFVRIPGSTRIGVKIVDEANQQTTDINMPGLLPTTEAMNTLLETIEGLAASYDWFALSGNLPPGVPAAIYATIVTQLKRRGKQVVLDTSGEALREGVWAGPTIVKPNVDELQQLTGQSLADEAAIEQAARQLLGDIQLVVISMGERGALFVDAATTLIATPPPVQVKSTVGAGDAMVAVLIAGQHHGFHLADFPLPAPPFSLRPPPHASPTPPPPPRLQPHVKPTS